MPRRVFRYGWVENGVGYIPLTKGQVAKVDPEDVDRLSERNWFAIFRKQEGYYYCATQMPREHGGFVMVQMHRFLTNAPEGVDVDHVNHDTLDNRKANLRVDHDRRNGQNARRPKNNTTGVKGVSFRKDKQKYIAYVRQNGKLKYLGEFKTLEEAASVREKAAKEIYGEYAYQEGMNVA